MFKYIFIGIIMLSTNQCNEKNNKKTNEGKEEFTAKNSVAEASSRLHDIWVLESMADKSVKDVFLGELPNLEIQLNENKIMGFGGCNRYFADIEKVNDKELLFKAIASTKKFCQNVPEDIFLKLLQETNTYKLDGLNLIFLKDNKELLRFKKVD